MTGLAFIWRKFYAATLALATGNLRVHDRLESAYESELTHARAPYDDSVPVELGARVDALHERLSTLSEMPDDDAAEAAGEVVAIYAEVVRLRALDATAPSGDAGSR